MKKNATFGKIFYSFVSFLLFGLLTHQVHGTATTNNKENKEYIDAMIRNNQLFFNDESIFYDNESSASARESDSEDEGITRERHSQQSNQEG